MNVMIFVSCYAMPVLSCVICPCCVQKFQVVKQQNTILPNMYYVHSTVILINHHRLHGTLLFNFQLYWPTNATSEVVAGSLGNASGEQGLVTILIFKMIQPVILDLSQPNHENQSRPKMITKYQQGQLASF